VISGLELKVLRKTKNEIVLEIYGEDDTLGNMITKEAMRHPDVVYASYGIPHPLQNRLEIIINVREGADVGKTIIDIVENIRKVLREFRERVEEVL
jgi:DNA-directed RNA polymerase subunit L